MTHEASEAYEIIGHGSRVGYQVCVLLAAFAGAWLIRADSAGWNMSRQQRWGVLGMAFVGSMVGCAIPAHFAGGLLAEFILHSPITPKTVLGGLLGSFLFVAAYKKLMRINVETSDGFARGAVAMMAIGRIGCTLQHCCFGVPAHPGLDLGDGVTRFPVQHVEAFLLVGLFVLVSYWHTRGQWVNRRLFLVFAIYGTLRFLLEFARVQVADIRFGIGFYQWLALALAAIGLFQILKRMLLNLRPETSSNSL